MPKLDVIVRSGTVVDTAGRKRADVAIEGGRIVEIAPQISGEAREEIDARGLHILPGIVDIHLHFNEPGHADWEGAATGSRALATLHADFSRVPLQLRDGADALRALRRLVRVAVSAGRHG